MNSQTLLNPLQFVANRTDFVVEAADLRKSYPAPSGELEVLRGIDLRLRRGEFVAVMGLSGVGKSTLLNIIGLLDHATSGRLVFHIDGRGVDALLLTRTERAQLCNSSIGFVFQFFHLLPDLNVLENVLLPSMIQRTRGEYRAARPALEARAGELLERMRMSARAHHRPNALSGGERQRVAIARALMNSPSLVLCDEPTGNLDKKTSEVIHDLFKELNRDLGTSILVVTHDPGLAQRADRTLQMVDGQFIA